MKDTVFDMVLRELPVDAVKITIGIEARYTSGGKQERTATTGYFPSKSEASFRRDTTKVVDEMKALTRMVNEALDKLTQFEDSSNKRFKKLENKLSADVLKSVPDDQSV